MSTIRLLLWHTMVMLSLTACASPYGVKKDTEEVFTQIENAAAPDISLSRLECDGSQITVSGMADDLSGVSGFMRRLDADGLEPELEVTRDASQGGQEFSLLVHGFDHCSPGSREYGDGLMDGVTAKHLIKILWRESFR